MNSKLSSKPFLVTISVIACLGIACLSFRPLSVRYQLYKWNPEKAVLAAQHDFNHGDSKVYLNGTIVSQRVGISTEDLPLVANLRTEPAGVGCIVDNWDIRNAQREYAIRYNQEIVKCLRQRTPRA